MIGIICKSQSQVASICGEVSKLAKDCLYKNGQVVVYDYGWSPNTHQFLYSEFPKQDDKSYEEIYVQIVEGAYQVPDGRTTFSHIVVKDWIKEKVSEGIVWKLPQYELNIDGSVSKL